MIKKSTSISIFFLILFTACTSSSSEEKKITIATAASSQFAFKELALHFKEKHNITVDIILGSSGKLTTQIINGAPYDLFFSANMKYVNTLFEKGKAEKKPFIYGYGVPVLWSLKKPMIFDSIENPSHYNSITHLAIANPKNAPYGEMAVKFLKDNNIYNMVENKLVYGESISQVNEYILKNNVDIGISAKSIVTSPELKNKGKYKELGSDYWIEQGAVIIKNDNSYSLKEKFAAYIQSQEGKLILKKYGYSVK